MSDAAQLPLGGPVHPARDVSFVVEGEPVACGRPRVFLRGGKPRAITPEKTRTYEELVRSVALAARPAGWRTDWARYALVLHVYRAERRGDVDNYTKAVLDGLQPVLLANDAAVARLTVEVIDDLERPRIEVALRQIGVLDEAAEKKARTKALRKRPAARCGASSR